MSVVSGPKPSAQRGRRESRPARLGWLPALFALLVASAGLVAASCSSDPNFKPVTSGPNVTSGTGGAGGAGGCIGPTCADQCATHPVPGCSCDVEGQHLLCGKVEATYPGEGTSQGVTVCGTGFSVCTSGVWGECQISGATLAPSAPPGYYAEGLGPGSTCALNPCDPQCIDFKDTPTGITGPGIQANDAGLTLAGDAGAACVPKSCATLGFNCGTQSDGCGNTVNCGTCSFPQTCGGGGQPSVCGVSANCTNLCLHQVQCGGNATTSISGTVYMPNGVTPLPNVLVYVPNAALSGFTAQVACVTGGNCTAEVSGSPLVATTTAVDGTFTLKNVPAGVSFPVVLQLGRFRREFTMSAVTACTNAVVPCSTPAACLSRFPRSENETSPYDNIPKMAFSTGCVDGLECVWRKVGIASSGAPGLGGTNYGTGEFTPGNTSGRINFYAGGGCPGTYIGNYGGTTPWDTDLLGNLGLMDQYDIILFPCQGAQYYYPPQSTQVGYESNIASFVNGGGRVFATHYSYIWLINDPGFGYGVYSSPLNSAIQWSINGPYNGSDPDLAYINTTFPGGATLASWLLLPQVAASPSYGRMQINTIRHDFNGVNAPTQLYVTTGANNSGDPMQASFNTPLGVASTSQCGRVVYSDFHVENSNDTQYPFPQECGGGGFSPQEFMLAQALFDLAGCVSISAQPVCTPVTCGYLGLNCGTAGDGCGGTLNCGTCTSPATCGGGGTPGVCGVPTTYSAANFIRDYDASSICTGGQHPVWRNYSWSSVTPKDSHINFSIATATSLGGLATATPVALGWSNPPGIPGGYTAGQATSAHAVNQPSGTADTELGGASPDATLLANKLPQNNFYLRVIARLNPSSDLFSAPVLSSWDMQIDCVDNQ